MINIPKIKICIRKKFQTDLPFPEQGLLAFWRERICFAVFLCSLLFLIIPYALAVIQIVREGRWLFFFVYTLGYLLLLVISLARRRIPFKIRAWIGVFLFYSFGLLPLLTIGPVSSGRIYLFVFAIITVLLLGVKAGFAALTVNICTIVVVGLLADAGRLEWALVTPYAVVIWKNSGSTFIFLNSMITVALSVLIHNLERGIINEHKLSGELSAANLQIEKEIAVERKLQKEALENEAKYRLLAENTIDCIWKVNMDLEFTYINPAVFHYLGYTPEEFIGSRLLDHSPPEQIDKIKEIIANALADLPDETATVFEGNFYHKNGEEIPSEVIGKVLLDDKGNAIGLQGTTRDIRERKKAEKTLQQARKMEAIGTLAGGIAHDFNNILSPIIGFAELALDDIEEGSRLQDEIDTILKGAIRAKELVKQILIFGREQAQEFRPLRVQVVIEEAMKLIKSSLPATIKISQNIDMDCGLVMADYTQIHQLIMNLCTNAYHAMEETGGSFEITLGEMEARPDDVLNKFSLKAGRYVKLTVSDSGHGMEPEVLRRIFDPYFTTKESGKGTGLGLAVVHGIVKECGGELKVYSEPGRGSVFHVFLPLIDAKSAETHAVSLEKPEGGSERILLVDDEEIIVSVEKKILERFGYMVTGRTSSIEALATFSADPDGFDLVITDLTMPDLSGEVLIKELLKIRPDIPVILCTGFSDKWSEKDADIPGFKAFLIKPVVVDDLIGTVRQVLDNN